MATPDEVLGARLAGLARQFVDWLDEHELEGVPGGDGLSLGSFKLWAGVYRRHATGGGPPGMWRAEPDEVQRLRALRLQASHVLLVNNPHERLLLPDGRVVERNQIVRVKDPPTRAGLADGLMTVAPQLASLAADDATLARTRHVDFATLEWRVDLVHDTATAPRDAGFAYEQLLAYDPPRKPFAVNVQQVPVPAGVEVPGNPQSTARRVREYREHLNLRATYRKGGAYYEKWRSRDARRRDFRPTQLSDAYLHDCFAEPVMQRGDDLLLLELQHRGVPQRQLLFRLLSRPDAPFAVVPLLTIEGDPASRSTEPPADRPIPAVVFHALDGGASPPSRPDRGRLPARQPGIKRFLVDYRAYVRWYHREYYANPSPDLGDDQDWFDEFVRLLFPDPTSIFETMPVIGSQSVREALFLRRLRHEASTAQGPLRERLGALLAWAEQPERWVLDQGMPTTETGSRMLVGVVAGFVYEWSPATATLTRMRTGDWITDAYRGAIFADVAKATEGMLPFIGVVVWGGLAVAGGAVAGLGAAAEATLGHIARTTVPSLVTQQAGRYVTKEAARKAAPYLVAMLADGVMAILPPGAGVERRFLQGFVSGFGGGAVEHYLSEIDDRLERQARRLPKYLLDRATGGMYSVAVVADKIDRAVTKLSALLHRIRAVLTDERARRLQAELNRLSEHAGTAVIVLLVVVVYLDFVYRARHKNDRGALDAWVKKQGEALAFVVRETGDELEAFAGRLQQELKSAGGGGPLRGPAAREAVARADGPAPAAIKGKLDGALTAVTGVGDLVEMILGELGVRDWDELQRLGFLEILRRGMAARPPGSITPAGAEKLGHASGQFVGTIMLERRIVPEKVRKESGLFGKPESKLAKGAMSDGSLRALWQFAIDPLEDLDRLPAALARGLQSSLEQRKTTPAFTVRDEKRSYSRLLRHLVDDRDELAGRLLALAGQDDLAAKLAVLRQAVAAGKLPPDLATLLSSDDPQWPGDAILFALYTWLRVALDELVGVFAVIEDTAPFGGQFRIAELLEVLGLDVALDDPAVAALKRRFAPPGP